MAFLGDIGSDAGTTFVRAADGPFTRSKAPTPVTINITNAPTNAIISLFFRGVLVDRTRVNSSGDAFFYDLDDGNYIAQVVYSEDTGQEGNSWAINVTGTTVTITPIATSGITGKMSFS